MTASLVSLISKRIIKPSIPTPPPFRSHKLSFLDQVFHSSYYIPFAFFYPKRTGNDKSYEPTHVSQLLEKSLSKTLSSYYPYAGQRLKNGCSVDCNDTGVELSHVRIHCPMSDILKQPYTNSDHVVFPIAHPFSHNKGDLALAQVSHFDCGGIAVAGCLAHQIGDGCTAISFFNNWGVLSRNISAKLISPNFVGESIYPQCTDPSALSTIKPEEPVGYVGKRFFFPAAKVNDLKALFSLNSGVQNPTRNEVVSALLYKCAVAAARKVDSGSYKPSSLYTVANMRAKFNPPLSQNASGNLVSVFSLERTSENELSSPSILLSKMRKEKDKINEKENVFISEVVESREEAFHKDGVDGYWFSSFLGYPVYKVDFGWGSPARVSFPTGPISRFSILMDNQTGGGLEALVMLGEQDMAVFETDPELLKFTAPLPNL